MNIELLLAFSLATAALAIAPGPDNIYVLTQSLAHGSKYGIATTAGLITGCLIHTSLLAFGVSAIIAENPTVYLWIKISGAAYLLYLAFAVYRDKKAVIIGANGTPKRSLTSLFKQGFVMNVLNPKVALFFLAFFPGFLFSKTVNTVVQFYVLGFLFMLISFIIFTGIALLAGHFAILIKARTTSFQFFKWLQILVFIGIAAFLLLS